MAHGIEFLSRVSADLAGSMPSFMCIATVMLLLSSQYVGSQDITSTTATVEYKCGKCFISGCIEVTDCITVCGACEAPMYKFKQIDGQDCGESRKRRQIDANSTPPPVQTTATLISTTVKIAWICKNCSLTGCKACYDLVESPACETCQDGYQLNNETRTCYTESQPETEESLSGVAIAGIVIAVLCTVAISTIITTVLLRKVRRSRDVTVHGERITPVSSAGSNFSSNVPQIPKINAKELLRKHDQITRYMKDPTCKDSPENNTKHCRSSGNENKELQELGPAPPPPAEQNDYTDMQQRYDPIDPKSQNDSQLYLPLQHDEAPLYGNIATVQNEFQQDGGLYENTMQKKSQGANKVNSANGNTSRHPVLAQSQDSIDHYEPLGTASAAPDTQEIYENDDSTALVQNRAAESAEIYLNEDVDDVYQNA